MADTTSNVGGRRTYEADDQVLHLDSLQKDLQIAKFK